MRVVAVLALIFGGMAQMLLDGQTFTHAVFGIICGVAAVFAGLGSARKDYAIEGRRWLGRIMAGLGLVLAIFCAVRLPSAFRYQAKFNEQVKKARETRENKTAPDKALEPSSNAISNVAADSVRAAWPKTVDEAVSRIIAGLSDADRKQVNETKKEALILFHQGWGTGIRNQFGLWRGNTNLMADCHAQHPDDASMVIIEAVWLRLQNP